jgi:hypothetical protein
MKVGRIKKGGRWMQERQTDDMTVYKREIKKQNK